MSEEEVAYKLVELYYTNESIFTNYRIGLRELINIYNGVLNILKGESNNE